MFSVPFTVRAGASGLVLASILPATATAQTVTLTGTVVNACVLTLTTPGVIVAASSGTELSTQQVGGVAALLNVVATGTSPTITFSAAGLTGPSAGSSTAELAYSSSGGASRSYSGAGYVYAMSGLLDAISVNGRATNASGFQSGVYSLSTTVTCSQP